MSFVQDFGARWEMFLLRNRGKYKTKNTTARRCFEYCILPHFYVRAEFQDILIVGVVSFTRHYDEYFKGKRSVYTIDSNPNAASLGIRGRHIIDSIENIDMHFGPNSLDCVLMNGVYGWGLDGEGAVQKALANIRKVLRKGGVLVLGWDKTKEHDPLNLDGKPYFRDFSEYKGLGGSRIKAPFSRLNHIFDFYMK